MSNARRVRFTTGRCLLTATLAWCTSVAELRAQDSTSLAPLAQRVPSGVVTTAAPAAALQIAWRADTSTVRETPHWVIPLFLLGGGGMGMIDGATAGAVVPTRCFGTADRAAGNGAGAGLVVTGLVVTGLLVTGSEFAWHVLHRRHAPDPNEEPLTSQGRRSVRRWLLENAAVGAAFGAAIGALAGISRHAAAPGDCFRSAPAAALHGATLYGVTGGVIFVPLAVLAAS